MNHQAIDKLETARRQLNAAVRLFFGGEDIIAVHGLTAASMQVLTDLGKKRGMRIGFEEAILDIPEKRRGAYRKLLHETQNYIKHADRPRDEHAVLLFNPAATELYLQFTVKAYEKYTGRGTPETRMYSRWFYIKHPDWLHSKEEKEEILKPLMAHFGTDHEAIKPQFLGVIHELRAKPLFESWDYD